MRRIALLVLAAAMLAGCVGDDDDPTPEGTSPPATVTPTATQTPEATSTSTPRATPTFPPAMEQPGAVRLVPAYETVALDRPVELLSYPLGGYEIAVADQSGYVLGIREGQATELLDLRGRVRTNGNEEGLLSMALDPQFPTNRHVWLYYSASDPTRTVLGRFTAAEDGSIDAASELVVLEREQPFSNHNGGAVRFGPDGMLYLGLGDGGSGGDPQGNGQNPETLLGTVLRLDVSDASAEQPYAIPADNPFASGGGAPEVWAYGLRNPWRMAFDPMTGALWAGDVGQGAWEEVDVIRAGENYGWPVLEGDACYQSAGCDASAYTAPVAVYDHSGGRCSVTGGVVARRAAATNIEGAYLHGDYCSGEIWAVPAEEGASAVLVATGAGRISSFAQVGNQIYVLTFGQSIQRLVDE